MHACGTRLDTLLTKLSYTTGAARVPLLASAYGLAVDIACELALELHVPDPRQVAADCESLRLQLEDLRGGGPQ